MKHYILRVIILFLVVSSMASCVSYEELRLFRKPNEERILKIDSIANFGALEVQNNDVISITVYSFDPIAVAPFNLMNPQAGGGGGGNNTDLISYLVDEKGTIDFPVLGKLKISGMTAAEVEHVITDSVKNYIQKPVVNVRILNFRVAVLGEVGNPGSFVMQNERLTLLEAISMAGDLTAYSNRNNVLVIREQNGIRAFQEVDLQSPNIFSSPYYYLRQGDVVYVEPTKDKEATIRDQFSEYLPWITGSISIINTIILIATRN